MIKQPIIFILLFVVFAVAGKSNAASPVPIYDATLYTSKPDISAYMTPMDTWYAAQLWPDENRDEPNIEYITACINNSQSTMAMLDIEHWPVDVRSNSTAIIDESLGDYTTMVSTARSVGPTKTVFYYSRFPIAEGSKIITEARLDTWRSANDYTSSVVTAASGLSISMYTSAHVVDTDDWVKKMHYMVREARRIGGSKPIYVLIWPQNSDDDAYLSYDTWLLYLKALSCAGVDGIIVWGGYQQVWDAEADWWGATTDFVDSNYMPTNYGNEFFVNAADGAESWFEFGPEGTTMSMVNLSTCNIVVPSSSNTGAKKTSTTIAHQDRIITGIVEYETDTPEMTNVEVVE